MKHPNNAYKKLPPFSNIYNFKRKKVKKDVDICK